MAFFDFKTKEELQKKIAEMERERDNLKVKYEKEKSDKELLQKELEKSPNFNFESLQETSRYKEKMDDYYSKMRFYELILKRYKEYIENNETVSIPNLKSKINPSSEFVKKKLESFEIDLEKEQLRALEQAKRFIDSIKTVDVDFEFWVNFEDTASYNILDPMSKAVMLCSFASAIGFEAKVLVCQMASGAKHSLVSVLSGDESIILDPSQEHGLLRFSNMGDYEFKSDKISKVLYEFNEREYVNHED